MAMSENSAMTAETPSAKAPGTVRFIGIDWTFGKLKTAGPRYWAFVSLLLAAIFMGVMAWGAALTEGGAVMGMRDSYPWGLWFVNYMYFIGLSAGGLVVYASVHLFGAKQFAPLSRLAVLQAGVLVMMALLGIVTDMERPWRAVWMLLTPNPTSPFIYTGSAANIYMIICFVDLWILITGKGGHKLAHRMTLIALPFAVYLHTTTAFVLVMNKSRELWSTAMLVPISKPGHTMRFDEFLFGEYAWAFVSVLVLGSIAFALLAGRKTRHLPYIQLTAAALYVLAIFLKRYALMAMGFVINPLGTHRSVYVPSLTEVLIALGLLCVGLLIMTLAAKVLPLQVPEDEHVEEYGPDTPVIGSAAIADTPGLAEPAAEA